jgi:hypothetical protein
MPMLDCKTSFHHSSTSTYAALHAMKSMKAKTLAFSLKNRLKTLNNERRKTLT